ncbi:MAG: FtsX-like permease family protein [Bacteroidales bacterium]
MNTPFFIARRLGHDKDGKRFTGLIRFIAVLSISLSLAVMILAVAVVTGFQGEIREKVIGFGSHIQITHFDYNLTAESRPVERNQEFLPQVLAIEGVRHVQMFATKAGIIKTDEDIHGVILKGIGPDFDWQFFQHQLTEGSTLNLTDTSRSDQVIVSSFIARRLQLSAGDDVIIYFIQDPPRVRRLYIAGIYETGIEELDKMFILGDIQHIQRLNDWSDNQVGGFEILVNRFDHLEEIHQTVLETIPFHLDSKSIRQVYPQIFDWLALLDMNVYVILLLMILVAGINMITTLLISVLEKTRLIGMLKAMGGANGFVRRVFLYHAGFLIARGMAIGNLLGILIAWIQSRFGIVTLPQESYYVTQVPINLELSHLLLINAGTFVICILMLVIPSMIVARIDPVKAIEFN